MAASCRGDGSNNSTIAVIGAGALGSVFASALLQAGYAVTLLGRRVSPDITVCVPPCALQQAQLQVSTEARDVSRADFVLMLVKTYDTEAATLSIARHLHANATVVTLQNGLGNLPRIRENLASTQRVLAGVTSQAARRVSDSLILHTGAGPTVIGYDNASERVAAEQLTAILRHSGLPAAASGDIDRYVWQKVAINAAINGPTAIAGVPNGALRDGSPLRSAAEVLADEASAIAASYGYDLAGIHSVLRDTILATADNRSSMLQDVDAGRRTEVDAIYGSLLAAGRATGLALPALTVIDALVRSVSRREGHRQEIP